jgi:hypothetical protein
MLLSQDWAKAMDELLFGQWWNCLGWGDCKWKMNWRWKDCGWTGAPSHHVSRSLRLASPPRKASSTNYCYITLTIRQ